MTLREFIFEELEPTHMNIDDVDTLAIRFEAKIEEVAIGFSQWLKTTNMDIVDLPPLVKLKIFKNQKGL